MPPLRQTHRVYPFVDDSGTSLDAPGIWFELSTTPGFVGLAEVDWPEVPANGNPRTRLARFERALNRELQELCEIRRNFLDLQNESTANNTRPDEDPITRDLQPDPFTRFEDVGRNIVPPGQESRRDDIEDYVIRVVRISVEVRNINPMEIRTITVSNAASGVVRV